MDGWWPGAPLRAERESVAWRVHNEVMRVFINSVVGGFEEFRAAAADAIRTLGHEVGRYEGRFDPQFQV